MEDSTQSSMLKALSPLWERLHKTETKVEKMREMLTKTSHQHQFYVEAFDIKDTAKCETTEDLMHLVAESINNKLSS